MGATKGIRRKWKSDELLGFKPTVYDWCRLAAFLDGEGAIGLTTRDGYSVIRVTVTNTNEKLILWLVDTFGGYFSKRSENKKNPKWSVGYNWNMMGAKGAWALWNCKPWFIIKTEQADLVLEYQESLDATRQNRYAKTATEVLDWRTLIREEITKLNARGPKDQVTAKLL